MKHKWQSVMFVSLIIILALSGCAGGVALLGNNGDDKPKIVSSNVISIPAERMRTLNPVIAKDEDAYYLNKLIYEGLFELDETLYPRGVLADSYDYGVDGTTMTIRLRNGILWHDGTSFTANDVKFSIEAYISAAKSGKSLYGKNVENIKSVMATDDYTVEIVFNNPLNVAVEKLTFPIIPANTAIKPQNVQNLMNNFIPVGTGPYMVTAHGEDSEILLQGYKGYRGVVPSNSIKVKFIPGKAETVNLFEIREVNLTYLKDVDRDILINNAEARVISFPSNEIEVLGFNFRHGALQDRAVRKAIISGIHRQNILSTCYLNNGDLYPSLYYPNYLGVDWPKPKEMYNPNSEEAQRALAGYEGLSLRLLVNDDDKERVLSAKMIKTDLEKLGVSISLSVLNWTDYSQALAAGNYDLFLGGYRINEAYDMRPLLHSGYSNPIGYSSPLLDILLDKMQSAISMEEKQKVYVAIEKYLAEDVPYYTILHKTYGFVVSNDLQGTPLPLFHNVYRGIETFSLSYEIPEKE